MLVPSCRSLCILVLLLCVPGCFFGSEPEPEPAAKALNGFRLDPEIVTLRPGVCSTHRIITAPGTSLVDVELEFVSDAPVRVSRLVLPFEGDNKGLVDFCAGDEEGEGELRIGVKGAGKTFKAGRIYTSKLVQNDPDPEEPAWIRGPSTWPTRVFWARDGESFFVVSKFHKTLTQWDAASMTVVGTHLVYGEDVSLLDEERVAVALDGGRIGVYSLKERVFETWYDAALSLVRPAHKERAIDVVRTVDEPALMHAAAGQILALGVTGSASCKLELTGLAENERVGLEYSSASPPVASGVLVDAGAEGSALRSKDEIRGGHVQLSSDGKWALVMPRSCYVLRSLINLETYEVSRCSEGARMSADASILAWMFRDSLADRELFFNRGGDCALMTRMSISYRPLARFAFSEDGKELAIAYTGPDEYPKGNTVKVDRYDVSEVASGEPGNTPPPALIQTHVIDARFGGNGSRWQLFHHIPEYSPDGTRIAVARPDGRVALVDVRSGEIRQGSRAFWRDVVITPRADMVLTPMDDKVSMSAISFLNARTGEVVREHELAFRVASVHQDGYVLWHTGRLNSTFFPYDRDGESRPYDRDSLPLWEPGQDVEAAGAAKCRIERPPGNSTARPKMCVNEICKDVKELTDGLALSIHSTAARNGIMCLFVAQTRLWQWSGKTEQAIPLAQIIGESTNFWKIQTIAPDSFYLTTETHLSYWGRP